MSDGEKFYNVIVSPMAAQMLASHAAFIANVNTDEANRFIESFEHAADSLREQPHRCAWLSVQHIPLNKYRFLLFEKRYLILFQIKDDSVYVDYVADCRQDYGWLLR